MSDTGDLRLAVENAAKDGYAQLHAEIRLYLETWAIARQPLPRKARRRTVDQDA